MPIAQSENFTEKEKKKLLTMHKIRHVWQLKIVIFIYRYLIKAVSLFKVMLKMMLDIS